MGAGIFLNFDQRNTIVTKGQQLKGEIVSALVHIFSHFSTPFHAYSEMFPQDFS